MRYLPHQIFLMALAGAKTKHGYPLPSRAEALSGLQRLTGQDFGDDIARWKTWIKSNRKSLYVRPPTPPLRIPEEWISARTSSKQAVDRRFGKLPILRTMLPADEWRRYQGDSKSGRLRREGYVIVRNGSIVAVVVDRLILNKLGSRSRLPDVQADFGEFERTAEE